MDPLGVLGPGVLIKVVTLPWPRSTNPSPTVRSLLLSVSNWVVVVWIKTWNWSHNEVKLLASPPDPGSIPL
jgi:hypothetical protein